jgi:hypothetical protein
MQNAIESLNLNERTYKGDRVAVQQGGVYKSGFIGRTGKVQRFNDTPTGTTVTVRLDNPIHHITEVDFYPVELRRVVANQDDDGRSL